MNLYKILNGYIGNGKIFVLVVAPNDEEALYRAKEKFKHYEKAHATNANKEPRESYWQNLGIEEMVFIDLNRSHASRVMNI